MNVLHIYTFDTIWGRIHTGATERGLAIVTLPGESARQFERKIERCFAGCNIESAARVNRQAEQQLRAYFQGKLTAFDLELDITGTPFQKKVLRQVKRIPFGQVRTYGQIARAIGQPTASRAVGRANSLNRLPLVIPCHRVVAADSLGGYAGGLRLKERLLQLEGTLH